MWRLIALATLLLFAMLGSAADAKCRLCVETVSAVGTGSGTTAWGRTIDFRFTARSFDAAAAFPPEATGVVMQVDGDRSKCATFALRRLDVSGGVATYAGTFNGYGLTTHSGRIDIGGEIYGFTVPLDGTPGTAALVDVVAPTADPAAAPAVVVAPLQPAPATAPQPAPASAAFDLSAPDRQGMLLAFAVIVFIGASVFVERRQAKVRRGGGSAEA